MKNWKLPKNNLLVRLIFFDKIIGFYLQAIIRSGSNFEGQY